MTTVLMQSVQSRSLITIARIRYKTQGRLFLHDSDYANMTRTLKLFTHTLNIHKHCQEVQSCAGAAFSWSRSTSRPVAPSTSCASSTACRGGGGAHCCCGAACLTTMTCGGGGWWFVPPRRHGRCGAGRLWTGQDDTDESWGTSH